MSAPPDIDTALSWRGRTVRDQDGEELGTLAELYLDSTTSRPAWAAVKRGLLRRTETIVPLEDAREVDGDLYIPYDRATFDGAPDVDPEVELTEEQERSLHEHYGREWTAFDAGDDGERDAGDAPEVVRSEEELSVRKQ